jgi:opacity protein-like surface antigen
MWATPFFTIGGGFVHFQRRFGLTDVNTGTKGDAYVGAGLRYYLTQRFFVRAEYKRREIFTTQNEDVDEWKAGFAFFY